MIVWIMKIEDAQMVNAVITHVEDFVQEQQNAIDALKVSLEAAEKYFTNMIKELQNDIN